MAVLNKTRRGSNRRTEKRKIKAKHARSNPADKLKLTRKRTNLAVRAVAKNVEQNISTMNPSEYLVKSARFGNRTMFVWLVERNQAKVVLHAVAALRPDAFRQVDFAELWLSAVATRQEEFANALLELVYRDLAAFAALVAKTTAIIGEALKSGCRKFAVNYLSKLRNNRHDVGQVDVAALVEIATDNGQDDVIEYLLQMAETLKLAINEPAMFKHAMDSDRQDLALRILEYMETRKTKIDYAKVLMRAMKTSRFIVANYARTQLMKRVVAKPGHLASAAGVVQFDNTCVSHSIARSLTRTFLLLTLIDGDMSNILYTAIYCMCVQINGGSCDPASPNVFDAVIAEFYRINGERNGLKTLFSLKYSDIKCEFYRKTCPIPDSRKSDFILQPLIGDLAKKSAFVRKLETILDNKIIEVSSDEYKCIPGSANLPTNKIRGWLGKRIQPTISAYCIMHTMVLKSWGRELPGAAMRAFTRTNGRSSQGTSGRSSQGTSGISRQGTTGISRQGTSGISRSHKSVSNTFIKQNDSAVCVINTWDANEKTMCFPNIDQMCSTYQRMYSKTARDETNRFILKCADFDDAKLQQVAPEVYDSVIARRNELHETVAS